LSLWRNGDDRAAVFAGSQFLVAGELLIDLSHRIGAVIADFDGNFVDFLITVIAEPTEVIDFARSALAFENDEPGVCFEARRVGHAGGAKQDLTGLNHRCLLLAFGRQVNQVLDTGELQRYFVGRIDVKIPALFAPAAQERDGLRVLPQNAAAFAFDLDVVDDGFDIDGYQLFHECDYIAFESYAAIEFWMRACGKNFNTRLFTTFRVTRDMWTSAFLTAGFSVEVKGEPFGKLRVDCAKHFGVS